MFVNKTSAQYNEVSFCKFQNELSPYGTWINNARFGQVWVYSDPSFRPYASNGHWDYTNYGWSWVSDFNWGWAPFHYGRWEYDTVDGWMWLPGYQWASAWVSWSQYDGCYGWAPLGYGLGNGVNFSVIPYNRWNFIPRQFMGSPDFYNHYIYGSPHNNYFRNSVTINNFYNGREGRFTRGPEIRDVERYTNKRIEVRQINYRDRLVDNNSRFNHSIINNNYSRNNNSSTNNNRNFNRNNNNTQNNIAYNTPYSTNNSRQAGNIENTNLQLNNHAINTRGYQNVLEHNNTNNQARVASHFEALRTQNNTIVRNNERYNEAPFHAENNTWLQQGRNNNLQRINNNFATEQVIQQQQGRQQQFQQQLQIKQQSQQQAEISSQPQREPQMQQQQRATQSTKDEADKSVLSSKSLQQQKHFPVRSMSKRGSEKINNLNKDYNLKPSL